MDTIINILYCLYTVLVHLNFVLAEITSGYEK